MKQNYFKAAAVALLAATGISAFAAFPVREFRGKTPFTVDSFTQTTPQANPRGKAAEGVDPSLAMPDVTAYGFLNAPDGSTWMYTTEFDVEEIQHNEYWKEKRVKAFKFNIFNDKFEKVGEISDKVRIDSSIGETGIAPNHPFLDPAITFNFFNDDDKPEIMVFFAMNSDENTGYVGYQVHFYEQVYSIGGEKDEEGYDVPIKRIEGRCIDSFNAGQNGEEDMYYTFATTVYPEGVTKEVYKNMSYEERVNFAKSIKTSMVTYSKADANGELQEVIRKDLLNVCVPGDTTDGIYLISKVVNGKPYIVFSQYEKPYFINPLGGAEDETCTPDNNFLIETYALEHGKATLTSTTSIPTVYEDSSEQLIYTFYSIGSLTWKNDVDMEVNGTPSAPAFVVTRSVGAAATIEDLTTYYELYDKDGKFVKELASGAESTFVLNQAGSKEPHIMLVKNTGSAYVFDFVDLYSGKLVMSTPQTYQGAGLMAPAERILGKDGKYKYVFALNNDEVTAAGDTYKKVAWLDQSGDIEKIDRLYIGRDVQFCQVNTDYNSLDPKLYDDDDDMEYAILVKRTHGATVRNEFIVADPEGDWYALFSADDGKGDPFLFSIYPGEPNRLHMVYVGDNGYNVDIYDLPFLKSFSGIGSVTDETIIKTTVTYNGNAIIADGAEITVYGANGMKLAEGKGSVSVESLGAGVYVGVIRDAEGNAATIKIAR